MAYKQNNPLNKNYSPLKNVMALARGIKKGVENINQDNRFDPSFNPEYYNRYRVVDQEGRSGEDIRGGYAGITQDRFGRVIEKPEGPSAHLYKSGDLYAQNTDMQRNMRFDPETGYSPRLLNISYEKSEQGTPYSAYIDTSGPGSMRNLYNTDPRLKESLGRRYDLTNAKDREEFEKARLTMYQNQMDMVNEANAMYKIADPEKYLDYYQDERSRSGFGGRDVESKDGFQFPWQEKLYSRDAARQFGSEEPIIIGAPGSDERANYLKQVEERYGR